MELGMLHRQRHIDNLYLYLYQRLFSDSAAGAGPVLVTAVRHLRALEGCGVLELVATGRNFDAINRLVDFALDVCHGNLFHGFRSFHYVAINEYLQKMMDK